ncbi:hypothetical protein C0Q70_06705 [Pomacea canaliculata]|uniref:Uncharacterized protein n=1 Tax=Pomacea canaliculata TaxID=400727 RepID=A0A2T7PCZ8_POMCA|nr:hypothetical protein C0Q70_06705 [Pomacea canaliculata]
MTVNVNVQVVANISGLTVHVIIDVTGVYHVMYVDTKDQSLLHLLTKRETCLTEAGLREREREGGREGGREREGERGRERGGERERERGREGEREGERGRMRGGEREKEGERERGKRERGREGEREGERENQKQSKEKGHEHLWHSVFIYLMSTATFEDTVRRDLHTDEPLVPLVPC